MGLDEQKKVVIIGNGISGITTARHLRKKTSYSIVVISEETPYFFSRTALMYVYMGHLKFEHTKPYEDNFWKKNKIDLIQQRVDQVNLKERALLLEDQTVLSYDYLIVATGSVPKRLHSPGEDLNAVQCFYHKKDLSLLESWTPSINTAVVVGGGLIGIELAEMLHSRGKKVHFLIRESSFWNQVLATEESEIINQHLKDRGIILHFSTELKAINGDEEERVCGIQTSQDTEIKCEWVGLAIGVTPNIQFLKNSGLAINKGIQVNSYLETAIPGVYAVGDCAELLEPPAGRSTVESLWYTGRMMGETVAQTLAGKNTVYDPGPWFNSAKFFDIEYQTYGSVAANPDPEKEVHFFWRKANKNCSIRLSYHPKNSTFQGIVSLGLRLRHELFDQWLKKKWPVEEVVKNLKYAFFDPEFSPNYADDIEQSWNYNIKRHESIN